MLCFHDNGQGQESIRRCSHHESTPKEVCQTKNKITENDEWLELQIESDLKNLEVVSDFIAKSMKDLGAKEEKDIFEVQLAVDEALTNIIEHAYSGEKEHKILVQCKVLEPQREFVIRLSDSGKSFDPQAVSAPDTEAKLDERKRGGLGIYFMKTLMQSVKYAIGDKGNELTMTKLLK